MAVFVLATTMIAAGAFGALADPEHYAMGSPGPATHPWAMRRADHSRSSQSLFPGPDHGIVAWKWLTLGTVPSFAVASNGNVHLGVTFHEPWWSGESYFTVLDIAGVPDWRVRVVPYQWGFSQGVRSGPALDTNGDVVLNSTDGKVLRFDEDGGAIWTIQRRTGTTNDSAPAIDQSGFVYHYQHIEGLAKYTAGGAEVWRAGSARSQSDVAVNALGECALGGVRTNEPHGSVDITYFNANGTVRWQKTSSNGRNGQAVFSADGSLVYQGRGAFRSTDGSIVWGSPSGLNSALGKNGQYYVDLGGSAATVRAHNAQTGAILWDSNLPVAGIVGFAIDSRDRIYVTTATGYLFGLSPIDGSIVLQVRICEEFTSSPVIGTDGLLYAAGKQFGQRFVFCIM